MRLICKLISGEELEFEVSKPSFIIGRSQQADVIIPHEGMSRKHCLIENKNGQFFITDLKSSNGVYIDEKRIPPSVETPLPEYLNLSFGAVQSLRIEREDNQGFEIRPRTVATTLPQDKGEKGTTKTDIKRPTRSQTGKHEIRKKEPSSKKNILLAIATIIVLAFMGYIYYQDKMKENAPLTPEEMYE